MSTIIEGIKFYTIPETAEALKVTPQTIRAYIKKGRIKSQRIGRPKLKFRKHYITEVEI